jgi:hypothetical protein
MSDEIVFVRFTSPHGEHFVRRDRITAICDTAGTGARLYLRGGLMLDITENADDAMELMSETLHIAAGYRQ